MEGEMNPKAAKGIAANIRIIAENTAQVALIDDREWTQFLGEARVHYIEGIEKAEAAIARWLTEPMTWR